MRTYLPPETREAPPGPLGPSVVESFVCPHHDKLLTPLLLKGVGAETETYYKEQEIIR